MNFYYHIKIPKMFNLMSNTFLGKHLCGEICRRLSAASDELGGCDKVRHHARHIELFSHIESGYETFNTNHDAFVVLKCTHYECCPPRKPLTPKEKARLKLSLASYAETFE